MSWAWAQNDPVVYTAADVVQLVNVTIPVVLGAAAALVSFLIVRRALSRAAGA